MKEGELSELRAHLSTRLAERRVEIESGANLRIRAVSDPAETGDPAYVQGLRLALSAAVDYAVAGLQADADDDLPVPLPLLTQARLAARSGVSLGTVLRRYLAGYTLFSDLLMQEGGTGSFSGTALQQLMRAQGARFDHLVAAITEEHGKEWTRRPRSEEERRVKQVEGLLEGELVVGEELDYDFKLAHVGMIASGSGGAESLRRIALELNLRFLLVRPDDGTVWGWLGASQISDFDRLYAAAGAATRPELSLALGEPASGLPGWRLTHRQARTALAVGMRGRDPIVRYRDVALVASTLGDDVFASSLRENYLAPLSRGRDRNGTLLRTLRAYFAAERNTSSAASALGVSRQTVINRLKAVEDRLRRPLSTCAPEMEAALRLEQLEGGGEGPVGSISPPLVSEALQDAKPLPGFLGTSPTRSTIPT